MNLDLDLYPANTAFVTLTMSTHINSNSFPGDYDPYMAVFMQNQIASSMDNQDARDRLVMADRLIRFGVQAQKMRRLGTMSWWDIDDDLSSNSRIIPATAEYQASNSTSAKTATSRRKKRYRLGIDSA